MVFNEKPVYFNFVKVFQKKALCPNLILISAYSFCFEFFLYFRNFIVFFRIHINACEGCGVVFLWGFVLIYMKY